MAAMLMTFPRSWQLSCLPSGASPSQCIFVLPLVTDDAPFNIHPKRAAGDKGAKRQLDLSAQLAAELAAKRHRPEIDPTATVKLSVVARRQKILNPAKALAEGSGAGIPADNASHGQMQPPIGPVPPVPTVAPGKCLYAVCMLFYLC